MASLSYRVAGHAVAGEAEGGFDDVHRVAFSVDSIDEALDVAARHGCHPLRAVATYQDV